MVLSLASLSSDTDSRTVNMGTLTVWRLGTSQYYVHVKLFWIVWQQLNITKLKLKNLKQMLFSQIKQEEYSPQGTQSSVIGES